MPGASAACGPWPAIRRPFVRTLRGLAPAIAAAPYVDNSRLFRGQKLTA